MDSILQCFHYRNKIDHVQSRLTPECSDANTCRAAKTQNKRYVAVAPQLKGVSCCVFSQQEHLSRLQQLSFCPSCDAHLPRLVPEPMYAAPLQIDRVRRPRFCEVISEPRGRRAQMAALKHIVLMWKHESCAGSSASSSLASICPKKSWHGA